MNRSSMTLHHARLWQGLGWALVAIVVWLSLDPSPPAPPDFLAWDKAQHALAYGTLAWWFRQSFAPHWRWPLFLVGLGIGLEFLQGLGGVRMFDVDDMLANTVGVGLGTALAVWTPAGRLLGWTDRRLAPA